MSTHSTTGINLINGQSSFLRSHSAEISKQRDGDNAAEHSAPLLLPKAVAWVLDPADSVLLEPDTAI